LRGERVLHELLSNRRGALLGAAGEDVLPQSARDALVVDAAVFVEALVLDRDDRVLDVRRDLVLVHEDPVVVPRKGRELGLGIVAGVPEELRVLRLLELDLVLECRDVGGDGHHHPEDGRDEGNEPEADRDERDPQLLELRGLRRPLVATATAERVDGRGLHRWRRRWMRRCCRFDDRLLHVRASPHARATGGVRTTRGGTPTGPSVERASLALRP